MGVQRVSLILCVTHSFSIQCSSTCGWVLSCWTKNILGGHGGGGKGVPGSAVDVGISAIDIFYCYHR